MSIEVLLDLIRQRFSPSEGQTLISSLQQDPLVWKFIREGEKSQVYFESAPRSLDAYSLGKIAVWLIQQETETDLKNLKDTNYQLPKKLRQRAAQAFETTFNTTLPPADLFTAGLLALTLRERRVLKGDWKGVSKEILVKRSEPDIQKNYHIWRTPLACLPQVCPDFDDLMMEFLGSKSEATISASVPLFIHALLVNPADTHAKLEQLAALAKALDLDRQLEALKWLGIYNRLELRTSLAKHLLESKHNIDFFAETFSELESFESQGEESDLLSRKVRYTLAEDLNRVAAFNFFSGDNQKARELYIKSSELLGAVKNQTLYQSLICAPDIASQSDWSQFFNSLPKSKQAHLMHVNTLIDQGNIAKAEEYLQLVPDSVEKTTLQLKLQRTKLSDFMPSEAVSKLFLPESEDNFHTPGFYAQMPKLDTTRDIFEILKEADKDEKSLEIAEAYLDGNDYDPYIIKLIRDIFVKNHHFEKAIPLTAYLTLMEPDKKQHKQKLAELYIQAERWQEAFSALQSIVKTEAAPRIEDLVHLAKSAMKTNHVDMSISICQNILQQDPNNSKALVILGEGYMLKGDSVKAIQHLEQVVEMIPDEAETWLTLARLWEEKDQPDRAFEILKKGILALPNDPELLHALGKAHLEKKAPSDAQTYLKKAIEFAPDNTQIKIDLAQAEYELGHYQLARQRLEPFIEEYEQNASIAKLLGHVLLAMDEDNNAEPILISAAKALPDDTETVLTAIQLSLKQIESSNREASKEKLEQLQTLLKEALARTPKDARILLHMADIARLKGDHQKAFDAYLALTEKDQEQGISTNWRFSYGLGQSAMALEKHEVGLAALQEASSKQPGNLLILYALAEAYQITGLNEKAEQTIKSSLKMAPRNIQNILWYANFKMKYNEPQDAVKALKDALQITSGRSDLKLWLAKSLYASGDNQETKNTIMEVVSDSESTPEELQQTAYLCIQINEMDLAVQALEMAEQRSVEEDPNLLMDLVLCHSLLGHKKKALEVLNLNEHLTTTFPQLAMLKSDLLCELGQYDLAFKTIKAIQVHAENSLSEFGKETTEAKKISPLLYRYDFTLKGYHYRLGQLHRALGDIKQAQDHLSKALESDPDDIQIRNACADAYMAGMDFESALSICEGIKNRQTQSNQQVQAHLNLVYTQAELLILNDDAGKADSLLENRLKENITSPRALAIMSQLACQRGEIETAGEYLDAVIDAYTKKDANDNCLSLDDAFQHHMLLVSMAEAATKCEEYPKALKFHTQASLLFDNQPLQNWRHAKTMVSTAQAQQAAKMLSIRTHAPGEEILSERQYERCQICLEKASPYLSESQALCHQAQCVAAFTGKMPVSLNINACLTTPEDAALVVTHCEDEGLVQEILASYPESIQVLQAYGLHALRFGKVDGTAYVEKALQMDVSNPINHALLARLNWNLPELALKSLETALEFWQDESEWHALAAELYEQIGDTTSASQHIAHALETQPDNPAFWQRSGEIKMKSNALCEAKQDFEKSAAYQSDDPHTWIKMADVNRRLGNMPEALKNMEKASSLAPEDKQIAIQEINYLLDQKRFQEAEKRAKSMLGREGMTQEGQILLARAQARQGKFNLALDGLAASMPDSENQKLLLERIKIKKERDGVESALPEIIELAQQYSEDPDILTTLTDYLIQTNRLKEAEETAQTILRIVPEQAEVHLMLGRLERKTGQLDQAIAHLSDAIHYDPSLIEAYLELGKTYQERRDLEQAIKIFQKGAQADRSDPRPYYQAGMALKDCKDYAGAEAMFKEAKKYAPKDPLIIRQLGVVTALNLVNNLRETR